MDPNAIIDQYLENKPEIVVWYVLSASVLLALVFSCACLCAGGREVIRAIVYFALGYLAFCVYLRVGWALSWVPSIVTFDRLRRLAAIFERVLSA